MSKLQNPNPINLKMSKSAYFFLEEVKVGKEKVLGIATLYGPFHKIGFSGPIIRGNSSEGKLCVIYMADLFETPESAVAHMRSLE